MDKQSIINSVIKFISSFLTKEEPKASVVLAAEPLKPEVPDAPALDWNSPECKISKHFNVKDATFLNSWHAFHKPTDEQKAAILGIAKGVDAACEILEKALEKPVLVNVHAWMRPDHAICPNTPFDGKDYNRFIYETQVWKDLSDAEKAAKHVPLSPHRTGHAVDFHIIGFEGPEGCAKIRAILVPHLEELGLRMEDLNGGWVHLDNLPVVHARFFKP